jgi:hypothetical protein
VVILFGVSFGHVTATPAFTLLGSPHGSTWIVPLYLMALLSGIRKRPYRIPDGKAYTLVDRTPADMTYGIECRICGWATPICAEPEQADQRETIHTKATGHGDYSDLTTWESQRKVI